MSEDRFEKREMATLLGPGQTYLSVTEKIADIPLSRPAWGWVLGFVLASLGVMLFLIGLTWLLIKGVGVWGINIPVAWGMAIVNFVWWIGIGHAGTLISAFLLLMRQHWRTSINRFAEAMTIFAVMCAGLFPLLHLGRPWTFYWMLPYPNVMALWSQFRSPLVFDMFAVLTYLTVSLIFWYVGALPDLATVRDRAQSRSARLFYGFLALGWRGSARHWKRYESGYLLMAGLAAPLVISVHSIVGLDFAVALVPGWHSSFLPPYFVAGAIYSGFAMVLTLAIPLRRFYRLQDLVTKKHIDLLAKLMLTTGLIIAYSYLLENFMAWYSADEFERETAWGRWTGPYAPVYYGVLICNVVIPQLLWSRKIRHSELAVFILSLVVNTGMWLERYMIIITSLHNDFMPSAAAMYYPTIWDWSIFIGTIGIFFFLFFLFLKFVPMIAIHEVKEMLHKLKPVHPEVSDGE